VSSSGVKTDNASLPTKVAIRRWLLDRMQFRDAYVLDTCAGLGKVWDAMEDHVTIRQWTRCDVKPRRAGTLALPAIEAVKRFDLSLFNVIDIDPYGEPFEPYRVVLERLQRPTAVFLTHGHVMNAQVSKANLTAAGIPDGWQVPRTPALSAFIAQQNIEGTWKHATILHAAKVALPRVTYYALGVQPHGR